jgi:hypothetical protein
VDVSATEVVQNVNSSPHLTPSAALRAAEVRLHLKARKVVAINKPNEREINVGYPILIIL